MVNFLENGSSRYCEVEQWYQTNGMDNSLRMLPLVFADDGLGGNEIYQRLGAESALPHVPDKALSGNDQEGIAISYQAAQSQYDNWPVGRPVGSVGYFMYFAGCKKTSAGIGPDCEGYSVSDPMVTYAVDLIQGASPGDVYWKVSEADSSCLAWHGNNLC